MSDVTIRRLQAIELFAGCRRSELRKIDQLLVTIDVKAGRTICREGARGAEFYVLLDGVAHLHTSSGEAFMLDAGTWFGERALLDNAQRNATVTTVTDATLLVFGRREFNTLCADFASVRVRLEQQVEREPVGVG